MATKARQLVEYRPARFVVDSLYDINCLDIATPLGSIAALNDLPSDIYPFTGELDDARSLLSSPDLPKSVRQHFLDGYRALQLQRKQELDATAGQANGFLVQYSGVLATKNVLTLVDYPEITGVRVEPAGIDIETTLSVLSGDHVLTDAELGQMFCNIRSLPIDVQSELRDYWFKNAESEEI